MTGWKLWLEQGLADDHWEWDWTTRAVMGSGRGKSTQAKLVAKSDGVWAADPLVAALKQVSAELDLPIRIHVSIRDGQSFKKGKVLMKWTGPARAILALERPFINLAAYACGIATSTAAAVRASRARLKENAPRIVPTRKTLPGYRDIVTHSVICGGGSPHRTSLSGGVLLKENHIAVSGGIASAVRAARLTAPHGLKIEVEVRSIPEFKQALSAGAEVIMLDNFTPNQIRQAVALLGPETKQKKFVRPTIEVSGGIDLNNISEYALEGVDVISMGSLSHSVKSSDLSLLVGSASR